VNNRRTRFKGPTKECYQVQALSPPFSSEIPSGRNQVSNKEAPFIRGGAPSAHDLLEWSRGIMSL